MRIIIDGPINKDLITKIKNQGFPVTHCIIHVPQNPMGNSSIFLPKKIPSFDDFKDITSFLLDNDIIPIAGLDSTCQGNLEAHIQQYNAINALIQTLEAIGYKDILVSSPNNIGFFKEHAPSMKIVLSYSQYVTSINRGKIFFEIGADSIILHPDIIRYFNILKNFIKLKKQFKSSKDIDYILPLNIGCNWGCIHWYHHHNLQSHRTTNSPVFSNQENLSNVLYEFDYPLLNCWRERIKNPENILKAGWISPVNIGKYENLGYDTFTLYTNGFSNEKTMEIINNYVEKRNKMSLKNIINIPEPYGEYWKQMEGKDFLFDLNTSEIETFCLNYPYEAHYPSEKIINEYCNDFTKILKIRSSKERENVLTTIKNKIKNMEKGAITR
ncbi:MAG: hypothetical protein JW891_08870 [Candidatus Lokiarchaeota archaeon]|nr:hypothetical protein [Candidatus Lokiarchaeota archaeon]